MKPTSKETPSRGNDNARHISGPADAVQAGFQHWEIPGHVVVHQGGAQIRLFQSTVQHDARCDPGQFHDRGSDHQGNIPGACQGDERL